MYLEPVYSSCNINHSSTFAWLRERHEGRGMSRIAIKFLVPTVLQYGRIRSLATLCCLAHPANQAHALFLMKSAYICGPSTMAYNHTVHIDYYCSSVVVIVWFREHRKYLSNDRLPHFFVYMVATNYTLLGYFSLHLHLSIIEHIEVSILRGRELPLTATICYNSICDTHSFAVVLISSCTRKPGSKVVIHRYMYNVYRDSLWQFWTVTRETSGVMSI